MLLYNNATAIRFTYILIFDSRREKGPFKVMEVRPKVRNIYRYTREVDSFMFSNNIMRNIYGN